MQSPPDPSSSVLNNLELVRSLEVMTEPEVRILTDRAELALTTHVLNSADGLTSFAVSVIAPPSEDEHTGIMLLIHGGGYVSGTRYTGIRFAVESARKLGLVVVSPEYRLAPENPYPSGLDDCRIAYSWLVGRWSRLVESGSPVILAGASAGGGLAAALTLRLIKERATRPSALLLMYPMLDSQTGFERLAHLRSDVSWTYDDNIWAWDAYLNRHGHATKIEPEI